MPFEAFAYESRTSTFTPPTKMFRGDAAADGSPIWEDVVMSTYITVPTNVYNLVLNGFSEPLTVPVDKSKFANSTGPDFRDITSLELGFVDGPGKDVNAHFLINYVTFSLHPRANLAGIYEAAVLNGVKLTTGHKPNFADMIGKPFSLYITASEALDDHGRPKYNSADLKKATPIVASAPAGSFNWSKQEQGMSNDEDVPNF